MHKLVGKIIYIHELTILIMRISPNVEPSYVFLASSPWGTHFVNLVIILLIKKKKSLTQYICVPYNTLVLLITLYVLPRFGLFLISCNIIFLRIIQCCCMLL